MLCRRFFLDLLERQAAGEAPPGLDAGSYRARPGSVTIPAARALDGSAVERLRIEAPVLAK